jgi:hypothetical protein
MAESKRGMDKKLAKIKIDRNAFSVCSLSDQVNDKDYWLNKKPIERIRYIEVLRRINCGDGATARLQRALESAKR